MGAGRLEEMRRLYPGRLDWEASNLELAFTWIRLGLRARWEEAVGPAVRLVGEVGRMQYTFYTFT